MSWMDIYGNINGIKIQDSADYDHKKDFKYDFKIYRGVFAFTRLNIRYES